MISEKVQEKFRKSSGRVQEEFRLNICLCGLDCFALRNN